LSERAVAIQAVKSSSGPAVAKHRSPRLLQPAGELSFLLHSVLSSSSD